MQFYTLIDPEQLSVHTNDPHWVIVDCRFDLADPDAGRRAYEEGHIPGAVYAHLDNDLSGPVTPESGRHPLPNPENLQQRLEAWGVGNDTQVVAYDGLAGAFAARLWWLLRWVGHNRAAVLNGGLTRWQREGYPVSRETRAPREARLDTEVAADLITTTAELMTPDRGGVRRLIDARAAPRFRGEEEPLDPVAGHIPGAVNFPLQNNIDENGCFLPAEELAKRYREILGDVAPAEATCMCGSGVTACHTLLAMEIAGLRGGKLYPGSWSEWIRNPSRPVATGP